MVKTSWMIKCFWYSALVDNLHIAFREPWGPSRSIQYQDVMTLEIYFCTEVTWNLRSNFCSVSSCLVGIRDQRPSTDLQVHKLVQPNFQGYIMGVQRFRSSEWQGTNTGCSSTRIIIVYQLIEKVSGFIVDDEFDKDINDQFLDPKKMNTFTIYLIYSFRTVWFDKTFWTGLVIWEKT